MQKLSPQLTPEISKLVGNLDVWRAPAYDIQSYRDLVQQVARLSYANRNQLLFFRGQGEDYQSKAQGSTLYPAIYREDNLSREELEVRFKELESAGRVLVELWGEQKIEGASDVARKKYVQWSLLQHYEVVATPLLDITHSLRVACSFAQLSSINSVAYVYALGFPYPTNRISINSEEELVNIRLLSICPPKALRPFFQEGYMAGTPDVATDFDSKTELDFRNRLIAKFRIPKGGKFWSSGFEGLPKSSLYPPNDEIRELCGVVRERLTDQQVSLGDMGQLMVEWARLEELILPLARKITQRNISMRDALQALFTAGWISDATKAELDKIRKVRNEVAHKPGQATSADVGKALVRLKQLMKSPELKISRNATAIP